MADNIIKNGSIVANEWITVIDPASIIPAGKVILPLKLWQQQPDTWLQRTPLPGLLLQPDDDMNCLPVSLDQLPVISVLFPAFTDGRGFSIASLLRERHGYKGELRAKGHFIRDQLYYMRRCGFDAFEFDTTIDLNEAKKSLADFSNDYQVSASQPLPLFRRRN